MKYIISLVPSGSPNNITLTPQEEALDIYWEVSGTKLMTNVIIFL